MTKTKIGVLGAGTWGTALARMLAGNGCDVTMWSALPDELKAMSVTHAHPNLPGMCLPAGCWLHRSGGYAHAASKPGDRYPKFH